MWHLQWGHESWATHLTLNHIQVDRVVWSKTGLQEWWACRGWDAFQTPTSSRGVYRGPQYTQSKDVLWMCVCSVTQSCLIFCGPMDCSLPGSSVHGTFGARILEWVVISYSRGSSWPRDPTRFSCISCIGRWISLPLASSGNGANIHKEP